MMRSDGHCFVGDTSVGVDLLQHLVDFFEYAVSLDASVVMRSKELRMAIALLEIPVSGWTC